jgi:hypothetical protein
MPGKTTAPVEDSQMWQILRARGKTRQGSDLEREIKRGSDSGKMVTYEEIESFLPKGTYASQTGGVSGCCWTCLAPCEAPESDIGLPQGFGGLRAPLSQAHQKQAGKSGEEARRWGDEGQGAAVGATMLHARWWARSASSLLRSSYIGTIYTRELVRRNNALTRH